MALYFMYYNFVRIHSTLRTTPGQATGVTEKLWEIEDIVGAATKLTHYRQFSRQLPPGDSPVGL